MNDDCDFQHTQPQKSRNTSHWKTLAGVKLCVICETISENQQCRARKLIEFSPAVGVAFVFHLGEHKCKAKPECKAASDHVAKQLESMQLKSMSVKKMALEAIAENLDDIEMAKKEAEKWMDLWMVQ